MLPQNWSPVLLPHLQRRPRRDPPQSGRQVVTNRPSRYGDSAGKPRYGDSAGKRRLIWRGRLLVLLAGLAPRGPPATAHPDRCVCERSASRRRAPRWGWARAAAGSLGAVGSKSGNSLGCPPSCAATGSAMPIVMRRNVRSIRRLSIPYGSLFSTARNPVHSCSRSQGRSQRRRVRCRAGVKRHRGRTHDSDLAGPRDKTDRRSGRKPEVISSD